MGNMTKNRAYQVGEYIQRKNITNYVVIDDLNISNFMSITGDDDKFVLTDDFEGLKKLNIKNKILKILANG
jgi:transposase